MNKGEVDKAIRRALVSRHAEGPSRSARCSTGHCTCNRPRARAVTHGTRSCYQRERCRCRPCRAAEAQYRARLRWRHRKGLAILGAVVSAVEPWRQLRLLKAEYDAAYVRVDGETHGRGGFAELSRRLRYQNGHLQLGRRRGMTLRNAQRIKAYYERDILAGLELPPSPEGSPGV